MEKNKVCPKGRVNSKVSDNAGMLISPVSAISQVIKNLGLPKIAQSQDKSWRLPPEEESREESKLWLQENTEKASEVKTSLSLKPESVKKRGLRGPSSQGFR